MMISNYLNLFSEVGIFLIPVIIAVFFSMYHYYLTANNLDNQKIVSPSDAVLSSFLRYYPNVCLLSWFYDDNGSWSVFFKTDNGINKLTTFSKGGKFLKEKQAI